MFNPLRLLNKFFQSRTDKPIKFADGPMPGTLGTVSRKPDKDGFHLAGFAPLPGAYGRTIRLHEADHLQYETPDAHRRRFITEAKKAGLSDDAIFQADQGLEDSHISTMPVWEKRPTSVRRDAASVALRELREGNRKYAPIIRDKSLPPAMIDLARAQLFNSALRSASLLLSNGSLLREKIQTRVNQLVKLASLLIGSNETCIAQIAHAMRDGRHAEARELTIAALAPTPLPKLDLPACDLGEAMPDYDQDEERIIDGMMGKDSQSQVPIFLVKPPLTAPCLSGIEGLPIEDFGSSGYRIARRALTAIGMGIPVSSPSPFIRRNQPTPGGCIVFDASGSMHVDADKLRRVCRAAPAATVVYYSGGESADARIGGWIVVYAQDGMRLDDSVPLPNLQDGNVADEQALLYGLAEIKRQGSDKPLILVSDLGFCGNSTASKNRAMQLVSQGQRDGSIEVLSSIDHALARFEAGSYSHDND